MNTFRWVSGPELAAEVVLVAAAPEAEAVDEELELELPQPTAANETSATQASPGKQRNIRTSVIPPN